MFTTETQRHRVLRGKERFKVKPGVHGGIGDHGDRRASGFCVEWGGLELFTTETQRHGVLRGKEKFKVNSGVHGDIGDRRDRGASGFCAWPLKTLCLCVSVVDNSIECLEITEIAAPRALALNGRAWNCSPQRHRDTEAQSFERQGEIQSQTRSSRRYRRSQRSRCVGLLRLASQNSVPLCLRGG